MTRPSEKLAAGALAPSEPGVDAPQVVRLRPGDLLAAAAVTLVTLAIYVHTLAPGLLRADSGEFQTLAVTGGLAHPTGYPIYLLLARASTWIPVGDVPYRVNLLSALMGALAAGGMYLLGYLLTGRRWVPLAGAVALAVSPTFWSQAIIAEVYTAGVVFTLGVLLGIERWRQTGRVGWLLGAACLGGLGLGVHVTVAFMTPACLLILLMTRRRWKANWTAAVCGALLGLLLLLAAFVLIDAKKSRCCYFRAVVNPSRSLWNLEPEDVETTRGKVHLSFSPPYCWGLLFSKPLEVTLDKAKWYAWNLLHEFPLPWLAVAVAGVFWLWRRNLKMALLLALTFATHLFYDLFYDMGGIHVLYIATYVPIAIFGTAGLACICDACRALAAGRKIDSKGQPRNNLPILGGSVGGDSSRRLKQFWAAPSATGVASYKKPGENAGRSLFSPFPFDLPVAIAGLCLVLWPMLSAEAFNSEGRRIANLPPDEQDAPFGVEYSTEFHQHVRELITDFEPDAVVFTGWCLVYPYYYVAHVEMGRTDMEFLQDFPHPYHFDLADSALAYVEEVSPHRPVYFTHIVAKVAKVFEIEPVRRGGETFFRVGKRLKKPPAEAPL